MTNYIHALGLISGGLDSTLASALLLRQDLEVTGVNFYTGFCLTEHRRQMGKGTPEELANPAVKAEGKLMFPVELVDISQEYLQLVTHPRYGYGKNANPCIDCRIMMLIKAKEVMWDIEADFIFTGEVLGQRPMTQMRPTLELIARRAGLERLLLRPLSAKLLPPTLPEKQGWVDREQLKDFQGRSRKPQIALAEELGITDYPTPSGGCCFLTDPGYAHKFFDLLDHREKREATSDDFTLLKVGRHLRVKPDLKVVVGRDEAENNFLERFRGKYVFFQVIGLPGPVTLMEGADTGENRRLSAQITARYSDAPAGEKVQVQLDNGNAGEILEVIPISPEITVKWIIR